MQKVETKIAQGVWYEARAEQAIQANSIQISRQSQILL